MHKLIFFIILIFSFIGITHADKFQFMYVDSANKFQFIYIDSADNEFYISHTSIHIYDADGKQVYEGFTDSYGRCSISLPDGSYAGNLGYDDYPDKFILDFIGSSKTKIIYLKRFK